MGNIFSSIGIDAASSQKFGQTQLTQPQLDALADGSAAAVKAKAAAMGRTLSADEKAAVIRAYYSSHGVPKVGTQSYNPKTGGTAVTIGPNGQTNPLNVALSAAVAGGKEAAAQTGQRLETLANVGKVALPGAVLIAAAFLLIPLLSKE